MNRPDISIFALCEDAAMDSERTSFLRIEGVTVKAKKADLIGKRLLVAMLVVSDGSRMKGELDFAIHFPSGKRADIGSASYDLGPGRPAAANTVPFMIETDTDPGLTRFTLAYGGRTIASCILLLE